MNIADSSSFDALSLGRDSTGKILYGNDVFENDPKISPDGDKVAFMRIAPKSGADGFGWHIFIVTIADPLNETDISMADLGSNTNVHDTLPEWINNDTLVISQMDQDTDTREIYTMNDDGSNRTKVNLPDGYRYADVFPFTRSNGETKLLISAEKISADCH